MKMRDATRTSVCLAILGSGGAGSLTTAGLFLEAAGQCGWYGLMVRSVGPQIRGGEAAAFIRLATHPVDCMDDRYDAVIAIDWRKADRFADEITIDADSVLFGDPEAGDVPEFLSASDATLVDVEFKELAKSVPGGRPNMVALGVAAGLVGIPREEVDRAIARRFGKTPSAVEASCAAVAIGLERGREIGLARPERASAERWKITGNEAAGLGAVRGGVRFAAAYPITPATEVLEWLTPALSRVGGVLVQAEDELASINMIIGASYGGTPALTATSGPGLALMTEALGLATAAEVPIVVVNVMRAGPSTGIPTKSEQADLNIAVYGCHGDAPHLVVAPLSVADCLFTTQWAVHLAESMQAPAIVLSDQFLGQAQAVIDAPATVSFLTQRLMRSANETAEYRRYAIAENGVSPMSVPGTAGGQYTADGLSHDESGTPSSRITDHSRQLEKRHTKIAGFDYGNHWADVDGDGDIALLTWGSLTGAIREAARRLSDDGMPTRTVALRLISPLRSDSLKEVLGDRKILLVEQSFGRQFERHLRSHGVLSNDVRTLHRPGPVPIGPGEICSAVKAWRH